MFHVKKLMGVSFMRRAIAPLVVLVFSLGVVYGVDTPEPAAAQAGWRICRAENNNWLYIKIEKRTSCHVYWISAPAVEEIAQSVVSVNDPDGDGEITFYDDDNYDTCQNFTARVFPTYTDNDANVCYEIPGVETADASTQDGLATKKVTMDTAIIPGPMMATTEIDLGVCISSGGCTVGYNYQKLDTLGHNVTIGGSLGFVGTYTFTYTSGTIEGYAFSFTAKYGDSMMANIEGGIQGFSFSPGTIAFNPKLTMRTVSNCDVRYENGLEKIAGEGDDMTGQFTGFKKVYFGQPSCLKEVIVPATATCSVDNFGDPLEGSFKNCYLRN